MDANKVNSEDFTQLVETVRRMETDLKALLDWYHGEEKESDQESQARVLIRQEFLDWAKSKKAQEMQEQKDSEELRKLLV